MASSSASAVANNVLVARRGPKPVVPLGMAIAAAGLIWMTKLDLNSGYATQVLPQPVLVGIGLGTVIAPAMSLATPDVAATDAGVASAAVDTLQQIGGSIAIALFSAMASDAATGYLSGHDPKDPGVLAQEQVRPKRAYKGRMGARGISGDRLLEQRAGRGMLVIALALIVVITVTDIGIGTSVHLGPLLVIAPTLTASFAGPRLTALVGALAQAALVIISVFHGGLTTANHVA
ncbi:hypothetical protein [Streptomyces sp. MK7]|uniref:hypothetical protein n=1 Tax=Streptomyces sp. MK7 TaxID=3067635 RepID=UPI00292D34E1|nr:hypothetical protein [Streptomyces sp. MK7]